MTSSDVNARLREISGEDVMAKDYRAWHGPVLAAMALQECDKLYSRAGPKLSASGAGVLQDRLETKQLCHELPQVRARLLTLG